MKNAIMRFTRAPYGLSALALSFSITTLSVGPMSIGTAHAENPKIVAVPGQPGLVLGSFDLAPLGYSTEEFFVSGTASSYKLNGEATADGRWNVTPKDTASYVTRIVVARPTDPKKFNGTVMVEWLNVSAGADGAPDWISTHREIMRSGYAYVAVSAQKVGIDGGGGLLGTSASALKKSNPERYGSLNHPGDAFSYDIFSQVGQAVRAAAANKILGPLVHKRVIAAGESQSAVFLTTYVNAVDPVAKVYDGFLIHSRFGRASSLENASMTSAQNQPSAVKYRSDLRVPVITVITETDLLGNQMTGYYGARVPDSKNLRVWEIAGTAHADNYLFGVGMMDSGSAPLEKLAAGYAPMTKVMGGTLAKAVNNAPQHHYVVEAALSSLDRWVSSGKAPPKAAPLKVQISQSNEGVHLVLDANGLAQGGVRTPWVDVPTARLSGMGNSGSPMASMAGSCEPFDAATLNRLYPGGKDEYLKKFKASLSSSIKAGFILAADQQEILDLAAIAYHGSH